MNEWKETEVGSIPVNWEVKNVQELVDENVIAKPMDGNHGGIHPKGNDFVSEGIPFVMASDINNGKVDLVNCKFIKKVQADNLQKGFSIENDVLLTHKASLGRTAVVQKNDFPYIMLTPQVTYYRVLDYKEMHNKYLKYYFDSPVFQATLFNHGSSGSTRAYIGITAQRKLPIIVPPIGIQNVFAEVLSSLDDKIDLLHRQNETLEQMAETLFRKWFVEDVNESWEIGTLKDEFNILMGQSPPGSSFNEDKTTGMPMYQGNRDFGFRFPSNRVFTSEPKRIAQKNDTLISVRAPVGAQNMANEECCIGRGVAAFRHKSFPEFYSYTYFKIRFMLDDIKKFNNEGTVFGSISKSDFEKMETEIPSQSSLDKIEKQLKPIDDKVISNTIQIRTLENLREALLPKLMSGEVRVNS